MSVRLEEGSCLDVVPRLVAEGVQVDAIVTDPPYHLSAMNLRFRGKHSAGVQDRDGAFKRLSRGFMGKEWDGGDIAFRPETWALLATILRPGGFVLAFGATRTQHRMVCAIEDGGFAIQDQIPWIYGSGWPKRKDMLKPAQEPICVACKPICVAYKPGGARTLQVDECRIAHDGSGSWGEGRRPGGFGDIGADKGDRQPNGAINPDGRWPANLIHDGSAEVLAGFPDTSSGLLKAGTVAGRSLNVYGDRDGAPTISDFGGDAGSAARFFYCAKASAEERAGSKHPTIKPLRLMRYLVRLVCPAGGLVLDPFAGTGTTGQAAAMEGRSAVLIEAEPDYAADIRRRLDRTQPGFEGLIP